MTESAGGMNPLVQYMTAERILHYAACDVAVFPSHYEPFGIVALEAMSMEKPVVVGAAGAAIRSVGACQSGRCK